ncbi:MAG: M56 family metallopeptidase [Candidatus Aminicenantes bacterium]|jgi:hypothetical protein
MSESIQYLLESGVCLAIFYFIYWVFLKKETFFKFIRFFLLLSIPVSFIIPLINITSPIRSEVITEETYMTGNTAIAQGQLFSISDILWFGFLIGAAFLLLRFILRLIQILLLVKKYGYHVYDGVKVVVIDTETAPFSFFNFLFISNADITDHGFERIFTHEMTHIKQYHSIDLLLMELLTIVQWFNPFVWPYKKSLKETHEYLADHAVIAQGCSRAKYQLLIFEQHVGLNMFEFTNNFSQSLIKRRITMMAKIKSNGRAKLKFLLIIPVVALLVLAFADAKPVSTQPTDEAVVAQPGTISQPSDQTADEATKKKQLEKQKKVEEILKKEAKLKAMYKETDDPAKKEKIKAKLAKIAEWKENNGWVKVKKKDGEMSKEEYIAVVKELKAAYEKTDDPEKKEKIKQKLAQLEKTYAVKKVKKAEHVEDGELSELKAKYKKIEMMQKELKAKYEKTDDPELKKKIKEKHLALEKEKELIKKKAEKIKGN